MKDKIKILLIIFSSLLLTSCGITKNISDIKNDFQKQFPNVIYEILEESENKDASKFGDYAANIKAKDLENNFTFNIYSVVRENAGFGIIQNYETDYLGEKLKVIKNNFGDKANIFDIRLGEKFNLGKINLDFYYTDKKTLEEKIQSLNDFLLYLFDKEEKMDLNVNAIFDLKTVDNGADQKNPSPISRTFSKKTFDNQMNIKNNIKKKINEIEKSAFQQYAIQSRILLLPNDDYPLDLIKNETHVDKNHSKFAVKANGKTYEWDDLITAKPDILHYRVLFEVLKRTEFEGLEGTRNSYSFIGKDNKKYQFNDKFNDKIFSKNPKHPDNGRPTNYYLVDGEVYYFTTPNLRYLTFDKLKEITGYEFIKVEEENKKE
ncbi:hypothetical protein HMPREF9709_01738 [Helcococcus kunzii ATCC 51366]|uniref:Lipoprotein n=1 Tax=Helcococcus kunzii ATCC 51366 TaxID=883114 RepID=H3NQX7_9FIRM|nr:hypothetical protein [Helcococcus kunzii]EHR31925.1 hypothetical protein HMPREF9709_01738 [Helcococcus kunzii ATCC 51366]QUY65679.1 hypothetical protein GUI37_09165 [Helcococcus kunzii]